MCVLVCCLTQLRSSIRTHFTVVTFSDATSRWLAKIYIRAVLHTQALVNQVRRRETVAMYLDH